MFENLSSDDTISVCINSSDFPCLTDLEKGKDEALD
jgi:hypothetical protein